MNNEALHRKSEIEGVLEKRESQKEASLKLGISERFLRRIRSIIARIAWGAEPPISWMYLATFPCSLDKKKPIKPRIWNITRLDRVSLYYGNFNHKFY